MAGAPRGVRDSTKIKYLQIYEMRKRRYSIQSIAEAMGCKHSVIFKAIQYCQSWALDLTDAQETQLLLDSKEDRIKRIYDRIEELVEGIEYEIERKDYTERGSKIYPSAEAQLFKELRELEDDIVELKGLLNEKEKESLDDDGLNEALAEGDRLEQEKSETQ